jgi:hypothetical protein
MKCMFVGSFSFTHVRYLIFMRPHTNQIEGVRSRKVTKEHPHAFVCDLTCSTGRGGNCTRTLGWNRLHSFKCIPFQDEFDPVGELGDGVNVQKRGLEVGPLSQYNEPFRVGQRNKHVEPTAILFCLIRVGYHWSYVFL